MNYYKGLRLCLLEAKVTPGSNEIIVLNKVIVTISDVKVGTPGKFSREPSPWPSLLAVDAKCIRFEKYWEGEWPESNTMADVDIQWSPRKDGKGRQKVWTPVEFGPLYNRMVSCRMGQHNQCIIVDEFGAEIEPNDGADWGDVTYCGKHDCFSIPSIRCNWCEAEELDA